MGGLFIITLIAALGGAGFLLGRRRSLRAVSGRQNELHSRPGHYGWWAGLFAAGPGLVLLVLWISFGETIIDTFVLESLPETHQPATEGTERLLLNDIHNIAGGGIAVESADAVLREAAALHGRLDRLLAWGTFGLALAFGLMGLGYAYRKIQPDFRARNKIDKTLVWGLLGCSVVAILTTIGIVLSLLFESLRFFAEVPVTEFLFGTQWSPQTALREDQVGSSGAFGAVPLFAGTLLISAIAMIVAVPIGLMSAIYMTQYARPSIRKWAKPMLEILAGIPTVVFGFFAALTVAPFVRDTGNEISNAIVALGAMAGLELEGFIVASESALAAGLVMGIMIIPLMSSLSDDAITAVPQSMRDGSFALGATRSETIKKVVLPAALPGIVGAFLLSVSRAIGETMIVVMAAGLAANLTANPLDAVTTVTAQIVALLTGDQEFDSAKTLSAFALGLVLLLATLALNIGALRVVRKYREAYE